jgi:predicted adenine nucleotide alpha hydrolase (AANH) superfamily ATPase
MVEYFRRVAGHEDERCRHCFILRLAVTAREAKERGFDAFTSTLLISPHQKHDVLIEVGDYVAQAMEIEFLYADLRKRYSDSRHITKPMDLYRQQYCGCLYSELERYTENPLKE